MYYFMIIALLYVIINFICYILMYYFPFGALFDDGFLQSSIAFT